ncbi:MAG: response regulator [Deltaproteobacteria bacterium]|nr:response regulator [Deltaproteobacteria bacterium]
MGWNRLSSLRVRLIAICFLVVVPAFGVTYFTFKHERKHMLGELKTNAVRNANLVAADENRKIEEARNFLVTLSRSPAVRSPESRSCSDAMAELLKRYPQYRNIGIADPAGNVVCSAVPPPGPVNVSDREYFRRAMETREFSVCVYQVGRISNRPGIMTAYKLPDANDRLRGVVFAALDTEEFGQIGRDAGESLPNGAALTKIDASGAILGRYPTEAGLVGKAFPDMDAVRPLLAKGGGLAAGKSGGGTPFLFAVAKVPNTLIGRDVFAVVGIPESVIFAELDTHTRRDMAVLGSGIAAALFLVWLSSGYFVVRPVQALLRATHRVAEEDAEIRIGPPYDKGELGELAKGFDRMTAAIVGRRAERERAREALMLSENNYRSIVRNSPLGIYRVTPGGKFLMVNPALVEMLGYESEGELLNANMDRDIYVKADERQGILKKYAGRNQASSLVLKLDWNRKDGAILHVRASGTAVRDENGAIDYYEVFVEDETERQALERKFLHSQRMEAVGRLAGGVAHDFNNLLSVILGYGEILLDRSKNDSDERSKLEEIKRSAGRAADLTRQLLAFSRKQVFELKVVDLNDVVTDARKMFQRLIGEDIELTLNLSSDIGFVKIDPGQFEQVIMNLVVNARDAMPRGGKLAIETHRAEFAEPQAYLNGEVNMPPGSYVRVSVTDTGCGMDEETLKRIFDPFFTTKEAGKGTGLGLSTSYGIVKQSGGFIWASSRPGKGTSIRIFLPRIEEKTDAAAIRAAAAPPARGSETILVAEDDAAVRNVIREFLESYGYKVLTAGSPFEALRVAGAHNGLIQLLVTDVVMPGESGVQLADRITRAWPQEKVLFISGYSADAISVHGVLKEGIFFLPKPFTKEVLAKKVREVLDS